MEEKRTYAANKSNELLQRLLAVMTHRQLEALVDHLERVINYGYGNVNVYIRDGRVEIIKNMVSEKV